MEDKKECANCEYLRAYASGPEMGKFCCGLTYKLVKLHGACKRWEKEVSRK